MIYLMYTLTVINFIAVLSLMKTVVEMQTAVGLLASIQSSKKIVKAMNMTTEEKTKKFEEFKKELKK